MIGGKNPTAAQKRWHKWLGQQTCCGCNQDGVSLHHCAGSTARHKKQWIGQWWLVPLCYDCHQGTGGVHGDMTAITFSGLIDVTRKEFEKKAFSDMVRKARANELEDMPPQEIIDCIAGYHK